METWELNGGGGTVVHFPETCHHTPGACCQEGPAGDYVTCASRQHEPGRYSADFRFACLNIDGLATSDPMKMMIERSLPNTNPDRAKFNGSVEKGAIHLLSTKNVGSNWCVITDLTITPAGTGQVIAEWKDCRGGHPILQGGSK